jgi:hypothetical protein
LLPRFIPQILVFLASLAIFFGMNCENKRDLCVNLTCVKNQGYCKVTGIIATCVCLNGYIGEDCGEKSSALKTQNTIVSFTSILAFIIIGLFLALVLFMDFLKYFVMEKIDRNKKRQVVKKKSKCVYLDFPKEIKDLENKHDNINSIS